jgi:hypothetical protein
MLWMLLLAHLLGDFPLQPDWMVRYKRNIFVLALHVGIHFLLMFLLVGEARLVLWPYLLQLTVVHMIQDRLKIFLTDLRPNRRVVFFFVDQLLHYLTIWALFTWIKTSEHNLVITQNPAWAIIAIAFLVVTYIWNTSERVMYYSDTEYLKNMDETKIARMLARCGFISLFFLVRTWALPNLAALLSWPYPASIYRKRAVFSDLSISLIVIIFLLVTLGLG